MKKIFISLLLGAMSTTAFGQWSPATLQGEAIRPNVDVKQYYSLNLNEIRAKLNNAQESGKGAAPVVIEMPTLSGKIEKFAVYSNPVVVKSLQDKYGLGSYAGVGIDDPEKFVRFSVSPYDFQSMIIKNGVYEFIEPQNKEKTVYGVHPKTKKSAAADGTSWLCESTEPALTKAQIDKMISSESSFANNPTDFSKASDKKYRTMRLAVSVNGEYTQYFGGVSQALAAINATLTRCNGVFEKDFALHLILQDYPQLIYTDSSSDPYTTMSNWNLQLQQTLTSVIGNDAYDIGHMFGASGGGGNAGCIGCVCVNPATTSTLAKGSGITSPADGIPQGDNFDIDYVAHEMGHQLGANHTFSMSLEGTGQNVEPGSGSTIMGYAGITGATDLQAHSDAFFHINSIIQVQTNLTTKTCDVETAITNQPPVITAMSTVTIPKSTPFVLTAQATDPEGDPVTYIWEQTNSATTATTASNLGNLTSGPTFRSWTPTTDPVRYFPKFSTVLAGNIKNTADWEAVPTVARSLSFKVTVRDNNADVAQQQSAYASRIVTVGANGPFKLTTTKVYNNASGPLTWDVVGTSAAPYNVSNVKIDYSSDGGTNWTVLAASTPNDGTEDLSFSSFATGTNLIIRVSAIDNIFYALGNVVVSQIVLCDGSAPVGYTVTNITTSGATISWDAISGASYILNYRKVGDATWISVPASTNSVSLTGLEESTQYEYQVAAVCSGTTGTYSATQQFTTSMMAYCTLTSSISTYEYISNVTVTPQGGTVMSNSSGASTYTDYTGDTSKLITLYKGTASNTISVSKAWTGTKYNESIKVWIDFNRNGTFETGEIVMDTALNQTTPVTATFAVLDTDDVYSGDKALRMRVVMRDQIQSSACGSFTYGEVEDYSVKIVDENLAVSDTSAKELQIYPNPVADVLNVSKVSKNAEYTIYSVSGKLVAKGKIVEGKINVSNLVKGVYIISVNDNGTSFNSKFIKK
ncbi:MAG: zinc-dependent metalloprotease family protein [Bergeyella sp.]